MEIKFNKEQIKNILKLYYKKYENEDCDIKITTQLLPLGIYEDEECVVKIIRTLTVDIYGEKCVIEDTITDKKLEQIFKCILKEEELDFKGLTFNKGIYEKCDGYGYGENYVNQARFYGIYVDVEQLEKGKQITLGRMNNNGNIPR